MVNDSISVNPLTGLQESSSFFKTFVEVQDELYALPSSTLVLSQRGSSIPDSAYVVQKKIADSQMVVSVFHPHSLKQAGQDEAPLKPGHPGWIPGILILCMLLLSFVKISFPRRLNQLFRAFVSPRGLSLLMKEGNILTERVTPPLTFLSFLIFALFFYRWISLYAPPGLSFTGEMLLYLILFAVVAGVYALRIIMVRIIGWVFVTPEQSRTYLTNVFVIQAAWSIGLIPLCILMVYSPPYIAHYALWAAAALFLLVLFYILIRSLIIGLGVIKFSWLYLFLYLCTVEILPLIVLGKIANETLPGLSP